MAIELLPAFIRDHYEIHEWKHAVAILQADFPTEFDDLKSVLQRFSLRKSWITAEGGSKGEVAKWVDRELGVLGWVEKQFETEVIVDGNNRKSPTHAVDCFKNRVALEIEWNNKDPFFDRDLNNFRLLFDLRAISVGIILTKGS